MNRQEIINKREIKPEFFLWKRYAASEFIISSFNKLFSLFYKDFSSKYIIDSIFFDINKLNITIIHKDSWELLYLPLQNNNWTKRCKSDYCNDNICLWIHHWASETFANLIKYLKAWLNQMNFINLLNVLSKDPKAKRDYFQIFWKSKRPTHSIIQDWWDPIHKIRFMVPEWLIRNADQWLNFSFPSIDLHHSERECKWIYPYIAQDKELHFFNFPSWHYDHTFDKYFYIEEWEKNNLINNIWMAWLTLFTDLNEEDIISWKWNEKLENEINNWIKQIDTYGIKMIKFNCCCVPRITWDDIYSILKKAKKNIKIPFVFSWQLEKTPYEQNILLLEEYLDKIKKNTLKIIDNSIILFWYHEDIYLQYLNNIFTKNWIKLNAIFLPNIDIKLLHKLFQTELYIFSPNKLQEEIFEYPFKNLGIEYINPKQPYWIINTTNWLMKIFDKIWKKYIVNQEEKLIIDKFLEKKEYIIKKKYSIWLIFTSKEEIELFFDIDYTNNVDIIEVLEEMWLELNFFIFKKEDTKIIEELIYKKTTKAKISFFEEENWMHNLIKESWINLIYSDIFFDDRIYKLELNQLNITCFNSWYKWALDSINTIIKTIEISYFSNFWKYLK